MQLSDVTFRSAVVEIEDLKTGAKERRMDIVEIKMPDGKVIAQPADAINDESGKRYCDLYADKYNAFKAGGPDRDRVDQLQREIKEREAELLEMHGKSKDDERVQENLRYGKVGDAANPQQANAGAETRDKNKADKKKARA